MFLDQPISMLELINYIFKYIKIENVYLKL